MHSLLLILQVANLLFPFTSALFTFLQTIISRPFPCKARVIAHILPAADIQRRAGTALVGKNKVFIDSFIIAFVSEPTPTTRCLDSGQQELFRSIDAAAATVAAAAAAVAVVYIIVVAVAAITIVVIIMAAIMIIKM